jgi:hypothetical protein
MHPLLTLTRKFYVNYAHAQNEELIPVLVGPEFIVHSGGFVLENQDQYRSVVQQAFIEYPTMGICVHDVVTDGEFIAVRFTEHGTSTRRQASAAWRGISLYRSDGECFVENWVELDLAARSRQFSSGDCDEIESPHVDPWSATDADPPAPGLLAVTTEWLGKGDLFDAKEVAFDDGRNDEPSARYLDANNTSINALVLSGNRAAFHVTQHGSYVGRYPGSEGSEGKDSSIDIAGFLSCEDGVVTSVIAVSDRQGLTHGLRGGRQ